MINAREEFLILIDLLAQAINAIKLSLIGDIQKRERMTHAHKLANRFIQYSLTHYHLCNERLEALPSLGKVKVGDPASIDVLTRAAMEAFLVFHRIFYSPATKDEEDYRYLTYKAEGLIARQNLPENTFEHAKQREEEKKLLEEIIDKLESNPTYATLNGKQRKRFIDGKEWNLWRWNHANEKVMSWPDIARDAGFGIMLSSYIYGHLSGHAHSGSISVLQTQQAVVKKESERLIKSSIDHMKILVANMIQEYAQVFPEAKPVVLKSGASNFVDVWVKIGRRLGEDLSTANNNAEKR